jgi:hypothetical protein
MRPAILLGLALGLASAGALVAQEPDTAGAVEVPLPAAPVVQPGAGIASEEPARPLSPRGAFIRSLIIPGWGQSAFGAYTRGGVYFSGWAANWFMNFKTQTRLHEARDRLDLRTAQIREELIAAAPDPDSMRLALETTNLLFQAVRDDPIGSDLQGLVGSREQQREDWIAWSLFWILASGIDAYVTAHLADFPGEIHVEPQPDGRVSFSLAVPIPRRRP